MVRLAELLGGLSLASDLVNGFPQGKVLRTALLAATLGERAGLGAEHIRDAYYTVLLRYLGCTGFAHEEARDYGAGDDIAVRNTMSMADAADPLGTLSAIARGIAPRAPIVARARAVARLLADREVVARHARAQCDTSLALARIVGMSEAVCASLAQVCERWDGRGFPNNLSHTELSQATRLLHLADVAEISHHRSGSEAAYATAARRADGQLDPTLCRVFARESAALLEQLEEPGLWERFLAAEPAVHAVADGERIDEVARAVGYFIDLKSVYTLGHSTRVTELAVAAGRALGLADPELNTLRHAACLHDVGMLSLPSKVWEHSAPLGFAEREQVRQHAYYTERVLCHAPALRDAGQLAASTHERLDGAGYHRSLAQAGLGRAARVLAAADAAAAMGEPRPYRPALDSAKLADELLSDTRSGKLDRQAVDAVLGALGMQRPNSSATNVLSERELEVLRLLCRGKTNREIGTLLQISARTVQNHVAHIYDKLGVYSRAGAALHAIEHGLL